jgi:hypothetical protein
MLRMGTSSATSSGLMRHMWVSLYTHIVHVEYGDEFCHLVRTDETHGGGLVTLPRQRIPPQYIQHLYRIAGLLKETYTYTNDPFVG